MLKRTTLILLFLFLISSNLQSQWEENGWEDAGWLKFEPSAKALMATNDNKILVNRGYFIDLIDTLGNKVKSNIMRVNDLEVNGYFMKDNDSIFYVRGNILYLYENEDFKVLKQHKLFSSYFKIKNGIYFAGGGYSKVGLYVSLDRGETWNFMNNGLKPAPLPEDNINYNSITYQVTNNGYVYYLDHRSDRENNFIGSLYVSKDTCKTFEETSIKNVSMSSIVANETSDKNDYEVWITTYKYIEDNNPILYRAVKYQNNLMFKQNITQTEVGNNIYPKQVLVYPFKDLTGESNPYVFNNGIHTYIAGKDHYFHRIDTNSFRVDNLIRIESSLYAIRSNPIPGGIVKFNFETKSWDDIYKSPQETGKMSMLQIVNDTIFAFAAFYKPNTFNGLIYSADYGDTWHEIDNPLPKVENETITPFHFKSIDGKIYLATKKNGYWISENNGKGEWKQPMNNTIDYSLSLTQINCFFKKGDVFLLGTNLALFDSRDGGENFTFDLEVSPKNHIIQNIQEFPEHNKLLILDNYHDIYSSDDMGKTFNLIFESADTLQINNFNIANGGIWLYAISGKKSGLYFSSDLCKTLEPKSEEGFAYNMERTNDPFSSMVIDNNIVTTLQSKGIYYKKNDGIDEFKPLMNGNMLNTQVRSLDTTQNYIFAISNSGFYRLPRTWFKQNYVLDYNSELPPFEPLLLFPNPSTNYLNIQRLDANNSEHKYIIIDNTGKELGSGVVIDNRVDVSPYPVGSYMIKIFNSKNSYTTKFIKQ